MSNITKNCMAIMSVEDSAGIASTGQKTISRLFKRKHSQINVWLRRIFISILVLAVVILSIILYRNHNHAKTPEICHSNECLRSAAALKHHMDLRVNPCEDFYGYVCGKWAEENPRDDNSTLNSWSRKSQLKIYRNIRDLLAKNVSDVDTKPVGQAKIMYQACLNKTARGKEGFKIIAKYLKEFGLPTLPTMLNRLETENAPSYQFDWISTVAKIKQNFYVDVLIGFQMFDDPLERNRKRIMLDADLTRHESNDSDDDSVADKYTESLRKLSEAIEPTLDGAKYEQDFRKLGMELANFTLQFVDDNDDTADFASNDTDTETDTETDTDTDTDTETYDYCSVQQLQNITDTWLGSENSYLSWEHYLEELFAPYPKAKPSSGEKFLIDKKSLKKLVTVISKQQMSVVELYIWERIVSRIINHKYSKLKTEYDCTKHVLELLEPAVNYAVTDKNFLDVTKPRVEQMLNNIRDEFNQIVLENDWMDADSKNATLDKSKSMDIFIGLPEWFMDTKKLEEIYHGLQIEKDRPLENWLRVAEVNTGSLLHELVGNSNQIWVIDPMEVNSYYLSSQNAIYLPIANIQYPFYFLGLESLNYGSLGWTLGHELTHGFDNRRRYLDKFGEMRRWWWNETEQEYGKRANCFVEQYSQYYWNEAKEYLNGNQTLNENIADNGGLREAFRAYQKYVKKHGPEPVLPGFESFSHEQLFFLSFASHQCETLTPKTAMKDHKEDPHSPNELRVKGVLSNMPEFSEAFQCPLGSPMNPAKKCRIW